MYAREDDGNPAWEDEDYSIEDDLQDEERWRMDDANDFPEFIQAIKTEENLTGTVALLERQVYGTFLQVSTWV